MNKEDLKTDPVEKPKKEALTSKEIREDTRGGLKEDPSGPAREPKEEKPKAKEVVTLDDPTVYARLVRMERMLEWLIVQRVTDDQKLIKQPNIADIFRDIASKMKDEKKQEKEDEVPTDT
jgi:hypothetical protein